MPTATIIKWFKKNVGKAIAILSLSTGLGGSLMPVLVKMIDNYGWRNALVMLSIGIGVIGIPISFVFRSRPEDYGLLPDGKRPEDLKDTTDDTDLDFSVSAREALKMRTFWQMAIAFMLRFPAIMAVLTHIMPYLASLGVAKTTATTVVMIIPLSTIAGQLPFGWAADIFQKKYLVTIAMMLTTVSLVLFWLIDGSSLWLMILFAVIFGLGISGFFPLRAPILRDYFGTRKFATISGLMRIFSTVGMFIGPPLAGWIFDTLGVYDPAWLILATATVTGAVLMLAMPYPPEMAARLQAEQGGVR